MAKSLSSVSSEETLVSVSPDVEEDIELYTPKPRRKAEQKSISITLDGHAVSALAITIALLVNSLDPWLVTVITCLPIAVLIVRHDYNNFLLLGPGGIPSTPQGYLLTVMFRHYSLLNPYKAPAPEPGWTPSRGILSGRKLPHRQGPRPTVAGIAPQRQVNQHSSEACFQALRKTLENLGAKAPEDFRTGLSLVEKYGLALYTKDPLRTNNYGEICHIHDMDHSMHMSLHPDDIEEVLNKGWGQRHPLAWRWRFLKTYVAPHLVLVYTPRDDYELHVVVKIIEASIWYNTAKEVDMGSCIAPV